MVIGLAVVEMDYLEVVEMDYLEVIGLSQVIEYVIKVGLAMVETAKKETVGLLRMMVVYVIVIGLAVVETKYMATVGLGQGAVIYVQEIGLFGIEIKNVMEIVQEQTNQETKEGMELLVALVAREDVLGMERRKSS